METRGPTFRSKGVNMKEKSIIALLLMAFCSAFVSAATISVDDAIKLAQDNNKQLQVARINLENSIRSASAISYLPSLSIGSTASLRDVSFIDSTYATNIDPTIGASISMSVKSTDFLSGNTNKLTKQSAYNSYEQSVLSVENSVRTAYYNLVSTMLAVESAERNLQDNKRSYESVERQYEGGKATTLALSQAELSLYDATLAYDNAVTTKENAYLALSYLIGLDDFEVEREFPEIREIKSYEEIKGMISSSLTYQKALIEVSQAEDTEKNRKASLVYPTVSVNASYRIGQSIEGPYKTSSRKNSSWGDGEMYDSASVSLSVSLPLDHLLPRSNAKVNLQNASSNVTKAQISAESTLESLMQNVEKAYRSLESARNNITKYEKYLTLAQKKLTLTEESYEGGKATYNELSDAKSALFEREIALLDQKLTYITAISDLALMLGVDSETLLK